ncbi:MAG: glycosyltransferase [Candidatus Azobacteroides sp.]|nr:glycosyltransferase [Candidatus Azobacteroides sp.]
MKKHVIISVTNDLVTDQRVHKVASSLFQNGYYVTLVGRKLKNSSDLSRPYKIVRFRLLFNKKVFFYAEYNLRLFFFLLFSTGNIFLSNDTDTLPANFLASKLRGRKLVFDAHEMFPEVPEVVSRPVIKKIWTTIEDLIFPKLEYCYTVCRSIADIYNQKYGISMQVIRNVPESFAIPIKKDLFPTCKKVIFYQGAINIGRGIEQIIDAMSFIDDAVFYIAGAGDILDSVKLSVREKYLQDKVFFLGRIPLGKLREYTVCSDLGVCLLENKGKNYYYSLPNRIFDFIHAEVPILATDFPEIRAIVDSYKVGVLIDHYEPEFLAKTITEIFATRENNPERKTLFQKAKHDLCWEKESLVLIDIFKKATN